MRLALSWLTVLPINSGAVDARAARTAIAVAPLVGVLLGGLVAAVMQGVHGLLGGFLCVGLVALATRGMHLDGLADTADGLGCYGPPERALAVMRDGGAGPFAVVALVLAVGIQAGALAALAPTGPVAVAAGALAGAAGRAGFGWACRRGVPAARPGGLGAQVAGSQPWWVAVAWWIALAEAGWVASGWRAPLAVALGAGLVVLLSWHTARRFGGVTGDVLGAASELATTAALIVLST
jgi:adenosylcobinamide-GDP ribazoletransferase